MFKFNRGDTVRWRWTTGSNQYQVLTSYQNLDGKERVVVQTAYEIGNGPENTLDVDDLLLAKAANEKPPQSALELLTVNLDRALLEWVRKPNSDNWKDVRMRLEVAGLTPSGRLGPTWHPLAHELWAAYDNLRMPTVCGDKTARNILYDKACEYFTNKKVVI